MAEDLVDEPDGTPIAGARVARRPSASAARAVRTRRPRDARHDAEGGRQRLAETTGRAGVRTRDRRRRTHPACPSRRERQRRTAPTAADRPSGAAAGRPTRCELARTRHAPWRCRGRHHRGHDPRAGRRQGGAERRSRPATSTSTVAGARQRDLGHEVDVLLSDARARANGDAVRCSATSPHRAVRPRRHRPVTHPGPGDLRLLRRPSCGGSSSLPVPVRDQLVVNHSPAVGQLEVAAARARPLRRAAGRPPAGPHVRVRARRAGRARRSCSRRCPATSTSAASTTGAATQARRSRRHTQQHVRHAAGGLRRLAASTASTTWSSAAPDDLVRRSSSPTCTPTSASGSPAVSAGDRRPRRGAGRRPGRARPRSSAAREAALVERLRAAVAAGGRGVAGLGRCVDALADHRVETLLVSKGYARRAGGAGLRRARRHRSPLQAGARRRWSGSTTWSRRPSRRRWRRACRVEICVGNADLDVLGRIGALLRY